MTRIVVLGAGIGGMSVAYELRGALGSGPAITVIGEGELFSFTPSNPWVAVGWRAPDDIQIPVREYLAKKQIAFEAVGADRAEPGANRGLLRDGRTLDYDYLVIATGPRLAFDEIPGLGPDGGFTQSVCTTPHASAAWRWSRWTRTASRRRRTRCHSSTRWCCPPSPAWMRCAAAKGCATPADSC